MRIIKYNRGQQADYTSTDQIAQQVASLSNQVNGWFSVDENGVLVSNHDIASTGQISSQYTTEQADIKIYDSKIEYIETTGTQFIDTGIVQNTLNFELTLQMQWTGVTLNQFESFVGYMNNVTPRSGFHKYQGKWMMGTNTTNSTNINADNIEHTISITCSGTSEILSIDGAVVRTATVANTGLANNTLPFYLGCRNRGSSTDNPATFRIMGFSYKEFTDATHSTVSKKCDFIPVRVGEVGYLYDKESKQLFGNAGTGSFIIGKDEEEN